MIWKALPVLHSLRGLRLLAQKKKMLTGAGTAWRSMLGHFFFQYAPGKTVEAAVGRREVGVSRCEAGVRVPRQSERRRSRREENEEVEVEPHARRSVREVQRPDNLQRLLVVRSSGEDVGGLSERA